MFFKRKWLAHFSTYLLSAYLHLFKRFECFKHKNVIISKRVFLTWPTIACAATVAAHAIVGQVNLAKKLFFFKFRNSKSLRTYLSIFYAKNIFQAPNKYMGQVNLAQLLNVFSSLVGQVNLAHSSDDICAISIVGQVNLAHY